MILLSVLLVLAGQGVPAPDHAAHVDRLLAALPPSTRPGAGQGDGETEADAADIKRLVAANPGKEAAVRAAIAARVACVDKASREFPMRALRKSAEMLTDAELDKLTEFYSGPDYARLLAAGDKADMKPFVERYPIERFMEVTRKAMADAPTEMFAEYDACAANARTSLAAAGVKD
ncbi:hypothetical protein FHS95_002856 [Sphingomonas naasensis]|uniref:DUF2059 domain-containing protein n=1 Tax=Sphingomonas naasensis TaxID=1344951 RepID=A0A4S1WCA2_9SPHN|nr:hypothetical protein [Sphingomonas naasensis]NIJ21153.1 hypothetical protein [Sphingomonas naasensis]TGX38266.1 hypothetical protein E5A74_18745 [Sphingomonas naasensis]